MINYPLETDFNTFLQAQLIDSCNKMFETALANCGGSYMDNISCEWYHSAWQYLRVIDKVSSPTWHFEFYYQQFYSLLTDNSKVLISGTADYTLLALVHFVAKKKNVSPQIWVCDICKTPLEICQYFAKSNNFPLSVIQGDIKSLEIADRFDVITTDAFLTRFTFSEKETIISSWNSHLSVTGKIVTTVRIEETVKQNDEIKTIDMKEVYGEEVKAITVKTTLGNQVEKIKKLSEEYISRIVSIPFTSQTEITNVFSKYGLAIQFIEGATVKGEVKPTKYFRLIAVKS